MDQELRRKTFTAGILLLLTGLFTILYFILAVSVEKFSFNRVKEATTHTASMFYDIFDRYSLGAELMAALAHAEQQEEDLLTALLQRGSASRIGQQTALYIEGKGITLFENGFASSLPEDHPVSLVWSSQLHSITDSARILGPLPSPDLNGKEILIATPLLDAEKKLFATFALRIPVTQLTSKVSGLNTPENTVRGVYLITDGGEILSTCGPDQKGTTNVSPDPEQPILKKALDSPVNTVQQVYIDGKKLFLCKAPVPETEWFAALLSPAEYEMRFLNALRMALTVAWFCLVFFILLLFYQNRRFSHYKVLSESDHLTGVGNRLAFEKALSRLQTSNRYPISLIMLDVDGLKAINDSLGHEAGDTLLRRVAALLQRSLREKDDIYRVGGDEFAIIFPGTSKKLAQILADRIMANVYSSRKATSLPPLSVSYGLAEAATPSEFKGLYRAADEAMYENKNVHRPEARELIAAWLRKNPGPAERRLT